MARTSPFGAWLRKWRKARGLTQVQLAQRAGLGQSIISQYERGVKADVGDEYTRPEQQTVEKLSDALGRPIEEARAVAGYYPSPAPVTLREVTNQGLYLPPIDFETGVEINLTTGESHVLTPDEITRLIERLDREMDILKSSMMHYMQNQKNSNSVE